MAAPSYVVLAEGAFDVHHAKTACVLLRYKPEQIAAVIDGRLVYSDGSKNAYQRHDHMAKFDVIALHGVA